MGAEKIVETVSMPAEVDKTDGITTKEEEVPYSPMTYQPEGETRMTRAKWLACIALALAYTTSFQQGACLGAIVKSIDEALGPVSYFNWMLSAGTISTSVALPLSGGLSDIFGRRWFLIIGGGFSLLGGVIALAAKDIPTLIASSVVAGLGAGSQQLALAAVGELVPIKYRGRAQAALDLCILPWSVFGSLTGGAMVENHGKYGFRINFIIGIILNSISILMAYLYYHPPSSGVKLHGKSKRQAFKDLDWTGVVLLNSGIVLVLVAVSMGGHEFAYDSPSFIGMLIAGILCFPVFAYWEVKCAKVPFMAPALFRGKGRTFGLFLVVDFVAGMGLYAAAAYFAILVRGIWLGSPIRVGILSIPGGLGGAVGGFAAGVLIGKTKFLNSRNCLIIGTLCKTVADAAFIALTPEGPTSVSYGLAMGTLSMFGTGWTSVSLIVCVQMACEDEDLGMATLILGAVRAIGGSVAITIYSTVLNGTMGTEARPAVAKAVLPLGFGVAGLKDLVVDLINENVIEAATIPGVTTPILNAARMGLAGAWTLGFHRMYMVAAASAAVSVIAAVFTRDVAGKMHGAEGNKVAVHLENDKSLEKKEII